MQAVLFELDGHRFALAAQSVVGLYQAVAVTALVGGPEACLGVVDIHGTTTPIFDLRHKLCLPPRPTKASDVLIAVQTQDQILGMIVDQPVDVVTLHEPPISVSGAVGGRTFTQSLWSLSDGLYWIQDPSTFFSEADRGRLDEVLPPVSTAKPRSTASML